MNDYRPRLRFLVFFAAAFLAAPSHFGFIASAGPQPATSRAFHGDEAVALYS